MLPKHQALVSAFVVAFAEQIEVVLQLFAGIAGQMAEFRLHGLRDQFERRQDVELILDMAIPHRFDTSNISLSIRHKRLLRDKNRQRKGYEQYYANKGISCKEGSVHSA